MIEAKMTSLYLIVQLFVLRLKHFVELIDYHDTRLTNIQITEIIDNIQNKIQNSMHEFRIIHVNDINANL